MYHYESYVIKKNCYLWSKNKDFNCKAIFTVTLRNIFMFLNIQLTQKKGMPIFKML